jgi:hypothetical protein
MSSLAQLEACFQQYVSDLEKWVPDGIAEVDMPMLQRLDLLDSLGRDETFDQERITQFFHVVESPEKITLFNEQFAVWIVPEIHENSPVTYALIGLRQGESIALEMVFSASGVYNTSKTVLRVLDQLLKEIKETESTLTNLGSA